MKLISAVIKILLIQIVFFIIPLIHFNEVIQGIFLSLNIFLTWLTIKKVEKGYYKNYNKVMSMLYMICPVIGISLTMYVIYLFTHELFLCKYYVTLIVGVYLLNTLYIIGCYIFKINSK